MEEIIILGGGVAGIGAAYILNNRSVIYEKENYYGGLCNSFNIEGYTFDTAIHVSFTKNDTVRELFKQTESNLHIPNPINYYYGNWVEHPIQNNLYFLSNKEKIKAVYSFINRPKKSYSNYKQYLYCQYGKYISENFMEKYTNKYWCTSSENMNTDWLGIRMFNLNIKDIFSSVLNKEKCSKYYADKMYYPREGGFKKFLSPLAEKCKILNNKQVETINTDLKYIIFSDGEKKYYNKLISSIPLPEIIEKIENVGTEVKEAAKRLHATSVALISIGFNCEIEFNRLWAYVYDEDIPFCRMYFPHIKSKKNVPNGCSSVQCEVYYDIRNGVLIDKNEIAENVCKSLIDMGICGRTDIKFVDVRNIKYANVVFDNEIDKNKIIVKKFLEKEEIELIGRFGQWEYYWSDQSLLSGMKAAKKIMNKEREHRNA